MKDLTFLINPDERGILQNAGDRMPLGLCYIAKELERHKHEVRIYDMNHTSQGDLLKDVISDKPTMIGVSCLTSPMVKSTKNLLKYLRANSEARLIVGGYHPSIMPDDFKGLVDNVVVGEGEYGVECLVSDVNGFICRTKPMNLQAIGKPSRHLLDQTKYNMQMGGHRTSTIITSRGCPNDCVFCGNMNKQVRYHELSDIKQEISEVANNGYSAIYFLDDVFTINQDRAIKISKLCKDQGMKFRLTTRANYLNYDLVSRLSDNGLDIASMGVESGNEEILKRVGKNQTKQQIRDAVTICYMNNVKTKGFFIIGLPGETEKTANETIRFAQELRNLGMEYQDFYSLVCYPGTELWTNPEKYGIRILTRDFSKYLQVNKEGVAYPTCETTDLSADKIYELLKEARGIK